MSPEPHRPRLVVAALTFRRNDDVRELLPALVEQARTVPQYATRILIVDNDPAAGAGEVVRAFAATSPVEVAYAHEPTPGIAAGRNRVLTEAADDDLLVFIDDDERPHPGWLAALLDAWQQHDRPAAVFGPVLSVFDAEPDAFVRAGDFFRRRRLPTGTAIDVGATNNLVFDLAQLRPWNLRFDADLGLAGGSDTLFTKQIVAHGGRMIWCDEAIVDDRVPAVRVTRDWVLRRALRSGNSWSRTTLMASGASVPLRLRLTVAGAVRLAGGGVRWLIGRVTGSLAHQAKGLRTAARGAGMASGAWGWSYEEYRRA